MLGGKEGNYSSDEESDTEEYKEVRDQVNPITASIDEPRVNPLEVSPSCDRKKRDERYTTRA